MQKFFMVLLGVAFLAALFLFALNSTSDQDLADFRRRFSSPSEAKLKALREGQINRSQREWSDLMEQYRQDRAEHAELIANLDENAKRILGETQEISDMREILFSKILNGRSGQAQMVPAAEPAPPAPRDMGIVDNRGFEQGELFAQLQSLDREQFETLESSQKEQQSLLRRLEDLQEQQQATIDRLTNNAATENQFENDVQPLLNRQQQLIEERKKYYSDLVSLSKQWQEQHNLLLEDLKNKAEDNRERIKEDLRQMREQQKILLENRRLDLIRMKEQQRQLQGQNDQLIDDLAANSKFMQEWLQERQQQLLDQQRSLLEGRKSSRERENEEQQSRIDQAQGDQQLMLDNLKERQRTLKEMQENQRQLLENSRGF